MKIYDICTKKEYEKNGEKKAIWLKCGQLRETDDGKRFIQLNHIPEQSFYCFEYKPKQQQQEPQASPDQVAWDE